MAKGDPLATQRGLRSSGYPAELRGEGFDEVTRSAAAVSALYTAARNRHSTAAVAVKVLNSDLDAENLERFLREQRAMGRLSGHPNIVNIMQVGTTIASGRPYLVMPYYQKDSLEALIREHGPLDWVETLSIGVKLAGALEAAHRVGTLHRDVKPGKHPAVRLWRTAVDGLRHRAHFRGLSDLRPA